MRIPPLLFYVALAITFCYGEEEVHSDLLDTMVIPKLAADSGNDKI
jgi:hypothetical protein